MVFRNRLLGAVVAVVLAVSASPIAFAQTTTTIEVPQGSGVFPTIGQVNCLEELGSGRFCATSYECSGGESGELWGDLANHNGRRAIGADSPVANQRDCVITVDGRASARWLTGYRPAGRTGDLVGLTTSENGLQATSGIYGALARSHDPDAAFGEYDTHYIGPDYDDITAFRGTPEEAREYALTECRNRSRSGFADTCMVVSVFTSCVAYAEAFGLRIEDDDVFSYAPTVYAVGVGMDTRSAEKSAIEGCQNRTSAGGHSKCQIPRFTGSHRFASTCTTWRDGGRFATTPQ